MGEPGWERVKEVCQQAFDRPEAEREAILDAACGGDVELRMACERVLRAYAREGGPPDQPHTGDLDVTGALYEDEQPTEPALPPHIGPYRVLRALGRSDELAHSSIRFTLGRFTTQQEVDYTVDHLKTKVAKLRDLSPLWEMHKEGIDLNTVQWAAH